MLLALHIIDHVDSNEGDGLQDAVEDVTVGECDIRHLFPDLLPLLMHRTELVETGRLELDEFMIVLHALCAAHGRNNSEVPGHYVLMNSATGKELFADLPHAGTLEIHLSQVERTEVGDLHGGPANVRGYATPASAVDEILEVARSAADRLLVLDMALPNLTLNHDTATRLFPMLMEELPDAVVAVARLVPWFVSVVHVHAFIYAMLPLSDNRKRLKTLLEFRYQIMIGMPTGHYAVNLSQENGRQTLLELSRWNALNVRREALADTSQHGNRSGFRNETLNCKFIEVDTPFLSRLEATTGLLEFDFVDTSRPDAIDPSTIPMSNFQFRALLMHLNLANETDLSVLDHARSQVTPEMPPPDGSRRRSLAINRATSIAHFSQGIKDTSTYDALGLRKVSLVRNDKIPRRQCKSKNHQLQASVRETIFKAASPLSPLQAAPLADSQRILLQDAVHQLHWSSRLPGAADGSDEDEWGRTTVRVRMKSITHALQDSDSRFQRWFPGHKARLPKPCDLRDYSEQKLGISIWDAMSQVPSELKKMNELGARSVKSSSETPESSATAITKSVRNLLRSERQQKSLKNVAKMVIRGAKKATAAARTEHILAWLSELQLLAAARYFSVGQACALLERWQFAEGETLSIVGRREQVHPLVELVIVLYPRLIDLYNVDGLLGMLSPVMRAEAVFRLGLLNTFSPLKPDGNYVLNLSIREDRQVIKMLLHLKEAEPGHWRDPILRWKLDAAPIPAWEPGRSWLNVDGIPRSGAPHVYLSRARLELADSGHAVNPRSVRTSDGERRAHVPRSAC